ncbi:restriction endonuclease subunit M [Bifidobacterium pseudolongum subsp. globosum]|uniref:site-specific DNA-methyltransferase (adenine-specific) n=1 Tax=Bifidobacterium pseudolongum subsp. globosum TaxID=1690 RepID=A0A4Q5AI69_9BIFI|nr:class I SAM-dependent DNA methyltransferase [Bifidobacterium pseudolongum]RYQ21287.1 restriction endonuclease subunit M [Bifidobacterium pseudolongum subsp. globosum]RYQ29854.1 restriction endonuclease subunit M [Bifidobacterium pseudolongum subsp. globosum]
MSKANTQTATDTNVLVGLDAVNGFYTPFFVQEILPGCIKNALGEWDGSDAVVKDLRSLRAGYTTICNNTIALDRREAIQDYLDRLLDVLGYDIAADPMTVRSARQESIMVRTRATAPDGDMCVQVLTCSEDDAETGILESVMDDGNLTGEQCVHALLSDEEHASRWILLLGLHQAALIDRTKWADRRYLLFDFDVIYARNETPTYKAVVALLSEHDLRSREGAASILDDFEEQATAQSVAVSNNLRYALRECVELLGNEVIHDWTENKHKSVTDIDADELTMECLRYMYRLLFLLFIEAKPELGYAPMKAASYRTAYSLESLRDLAESMRGRMDELEDTTYAADTLHILDEIIYNGYPAKTRADDIRTIHGADEAFTLPPLKAHIFDPERTHMIEDAQLRDSVMLRIIDMMSVSSTGTGKARRRQRIAYSSLGVSQMGAIYEGLLSYRGFIATTTLYEVKRDNGDKKTKKGKFDPLAVGYFVNEHQLSDYTEAERVRYEDGLYKDELRTYESGTFIYRRTGRERENSASYYTPDSLAQCLVKYALKVIEPRIHKAADILALRICEPAMGSATFLNEAINQLAEWYLRLREQELVDEQGPDAAIPADERQAELQKVKMLIADRNVYGVDLNPVAVELAEVALWLNSICPGSFIPWFGDQLMCGNSLIGARRRAYTPAELTTATKGMQWYCHEPQRVALTPKARHGSRIYQFLTGDPGMCSYSDKIVKSLELEHLAKMKNWSKTFTKSYSDDDIALMQRLSTVIDHLWRGVVDMRRQLSATTHDALKVYGWQGEPESGTLPVSAKDALLNQSYHSIGASNAGEYARLKLAMDYWCALWFWPIEEADLLPTRDEYLHDMQLILNGEPLDPEPDVLVNPDEDINEALANEMGDMTLFNEGMTPISEDNPHEYMMRHTVDLDDLVERQPRLQLVRKISGQQRFFHWELEFADVFADGGFDFMVGNPPWVKLQWEADNVLADVDPQYAVHKQSASDLNKVILDILGSSDAMRQHFISEYEKYAGQSSFFNALGNYPLLQGQQTNVFRCFLPNAWDYTRRSNGVSAFIHPDEIYADMKAGVLREQMVKRLRYLFQFINEKKLFDGVDHHTSFSLNIYDNGGTSSIRFDSIWKLYLPKTIDECYADAAHTTVQPMKTETGQWNVQGYHDRIVTIDDAVMRMYAVLANTSIAEATSAPVLGLYTVSLLHALECIGQCSQHLSDIPENEITYSSMWHETNSRKDGTIGDDVHFPNGDEPIVYSGPFIGVGNPLLQSSRRHYKGNSDYDFVDLTAIPADYEPRVKYAQACSSAEYAKRMPKMTDGTPFDAVYRVVCRGMVGLSSERTLQSAGVHPRVAWVHAVTGYGVHPQRYATLALMMGAQASLPLDYLVRSIGKTNINTGTLQLLPIPNGVLASEIILRGLLLNCLTGGYAELWQSCWSNSYTTVEWSKRDSRLPNTTFSSLADTWTYETPLRSEYSRRQALVELDVLVAMALGMTLDELIDIYRFTFSVLKSYEDDTWYDRNGRVVYSYKGAYAKISLKRDEFERIRDEQDGFVKTITIEDDTLPDGPIKRDIRFVAPYDRCDRIEDYRTAWAFFEAKYGEALAQERLEREAMQATKAEQEGGR